jgi:serine phosphatase RsbU (regulator of sigma subunit)
MISELRVRRRDEKVRTIPLDRGPLTIGRALDNDLSYPDEGSLSRYHLTFERDGLRWFVTDLGSTNGTFVNGKRLTVRVPFEPGDRLVAGYLTITGVDADAAREESVVFVPAGPSGALGPQTMTTSLKDVLSRDSTLPARGALQGLIDAVQGLTGQQTLEELFALILRRAIEAVKAERGVLITQEHGRLVPRATHGEGFQISTTIRDRVLNNRESLLVRDVGQEEALLLQHSISQQHIHSLMAVPLQTAGEVIGLIYVDSRLFGKTFAENDLILLSVFASVAAIRIDRERHIELQRQEQFRTRDLQQAAEIQRGILPGKPPAVARFDLAGHNAPCQTVGGDFYDFIPYPDGRLGLVLADVAGKGMAAAMLVSNLQACVRLLTEDPPELKTLIARLNKSMEARCPSNRFITLFMIVIDPATGAATYCNAGHNPALLVRASGEVEELSAVGTILGFLPDIVYEEHPAHLAEGDMLVLYSDGITEAMDASQAQFGEERLRALVAARRNDAASDIVGAVVSAVAAWCPSEVADDDITIIVARRR